MTRHYLDHASTTPLRPAAAAALRAWLDEAAADPGRVHEEGRRVRAEIESARELVASLAGVAPRQVVFTSGATEAVNAAVWGAVRRHPGRPVLCADVEHSAVRDASSRLAPVEVLPVDRFGRLDVAALSESLARAAASDAGPAALVHCQWANHEVGTMQPVAEVVALCRSAGVAVHVDAAAAFGHLETEPVLAEADFVSLSAHKLGGAPGTGALLVRRGLRVEPFIVGGQQERARRGGLENVSGIVAFGAAVSELLADESEGVGEGLRREAAAAKALVSALVSAATSVEGVTVVGDPDPAARLPHLVCLGIEGVEAEPVLLGLDRAGIAAHSGSACASESLEPSPVLEAMGEDPSHSLRLSVGWSSTDDDVAAFASAFGAVIEGLRALRS